MVINPNAIPVVAELVVAEDFYRETHRLIFAAIHALYEKGEEVDVVTLGAELERQGVLERVGGRDFVHTLAEMVPAATNALQYAGIVREQSVLRALIQVGNEIAELGYQHPDEVHQPARPLRAKGLRHLAAPLAPPSSSTIRDIVTRNSERPEMMQRDTKVSGVAPVSPTSTGSPAVFSPPTLSCSPPGRAWARRRWPSTSPRTSASRASAGRRLQPRDELVRSSATACCARRLA